MMNAQHFAVLLQGVTAWNAWRLAHPETRPDLSCVDLSGRYIPLPQLRRTGSDDAHILRTCLCGVDFSGVDLSGARLVHVNFSGANFAGANLSGADLRWAILTNADLRGADIQQANLKWVDLSHVQGLYYAFDNRGMRCGGERRNVAAVERSVARHASAHRPH